MAPTCEQLLNVLAYESLVQRVSRPATRPGAIIDQFPLASPETARRIILRRENERLCDLFEREARLVALPSLSVRDLHEYFSGREGHVLVRRRVGRRIARSLGGYRRIDNPNYVRLGYHGILGDGVIVTSPTSGLLVADVFPDAAVYFTPPKAFLYWSRIAKGRMQFSVELAPNTEIEKVVVDL